MEWLKSKTTAVAGGCLALIGLQGYGLMSMRGTVDERMGAMERQIQVMQAEDSTKLTQISSDLDVVTQRMGITAQELEQAHKLAQQLKQENAKTTQRLRSELAAKADTKMVDEFKAEASTRLTEVQQDATTKFGTVSGEVQVVRTDLDATKADLASSRADLTDVKSLVARNGTELAALRLKGERDYIEFDINKTKNFERIGDVQVQLKKADTKKQKYTVMILADDNRFEKKDRAANEPVTFLVGRDRLRYEFVVNYVDKDRIRGYVSTPKDKVLAAEGPSPRRVQ